MIAERRTFARRSARSCGLISGMAQCSTPRAMISRAGGVDQLWYGGGEESSHSRPCAPSQERAFAFSPAFTHFQMMYGKSSCDRPKPNPPIEDTMFQSANCVE